MATHPASSADGTAASRAAKDPSDPGGATVAQARRTPPRARSQESVSSSSSSSSSSSLPPNDRLANSPKETTQDLPPGASGANHGDESVIGALDLSMNGDPKAGHFGRLGCDDGSVNGDVIRGPVTVDKSQKDGEGPRADLAGRPTSPPATAAAASSSSSSSSTIASDDDVVNDGCTKQKDESHGAAHDRNVHWEYGQRRTKRPTFELQRRGTGYPKNQKSNAEDDDHDDEVAVATSEEDDEDEPEPSDENRSEYGPVTRPGILSSRQQGGTRLQEGEDGQPHVYRRRGGDGRPIDHRRASSGASSQSSGAESCTSAESNGDDSRFDDVFHGGAAGLEGFFAAALGRRRRRTSHDSAEQGHAHHHRRQEKRDKLRRRRWDDEMLFRCGSASSSLHQEKTQSEEAAGEKENGRGRRRNDSDDHTQRSSFTSSVRSLGSHRRNHSQERHSDDLNTPYIPSHRHAAQHRHHPNASIASSQLFKGVIQSVKQDRDLLGSRKGTNRSLAALVVSTSGLAGAATPELSHYAPAFGPEAETTKGRRKIVRYSNPEEDDRQLASEIDADARQEAQESGQPLGSTQAQTLQENKGGRRGRRGKRRQREIHIVRHPASLQARQEFIEHLAKALVNFGAPSHSIESWLETTADVLGVQASFIYFPSVLLVAFKDDSDVRSTETLFIRTSGGLDLYRLSLVHKVYRRVARDEISVSQGSRALRRITKGSKPYHWSILLLAGAISSAGASAVAFSGSFVDMLMSAALGTLLAFVILFVMGRHRIVSNIFEIGTAGLIAFISRGLGATGYFCYSSIVSGSIVLLLPGWQICLGALELGSRNIVSGAIRIVWAIVYTLFLSFGIAIGAEIMDATGVKQTQAATTGGNSVQTVTISGSFLSNDTAFDESFRNGTFMFSNGTTSTQDAQVACYRDPMLAGLWYYETLPSWTLLFLVPIFAAALAVWFRADWRSRDMGVMIVVASIGYVVAFFIKEALPSRTDVQSAVAAFAIGLAGNIYSRLAGGSAFPSMVVGILLEVPNSIAAAGGLSISSSSSSSTTSVAGTDQSISSTVVIAIRMIQTAIGLAIGLFAAALVVYPFGKKGYVFAF